MNREGYLAWRNELKLWHAKRACELMAQAGYSQEGAGPGRDPDQEREIQERCRRATAGGCGLSGIPAPLFCRVCQPAQPGEDHRHSRQNLA